LRTEIINKLGLKVIRFKNADVENSLEEVTKKLGEYLTSP